jgi:predicted Zn-dependent peptidase
MSTSTAPAVASVVTLANGVRVLTLPMPHLHSASVSVFVRTGSVHESARLSGISHVVEHMAFKGTTGRDCRTINLDAELLGAEVNAHTDKDHTAYHMRGLAGHAGQFIAMLGDIVCHSSFPEAELERERQVILQEVLEDEDDPVSTAFKLFDSACWGRHAMARPVIGSRRCIEAFTRDDLLAYVGRQYSGANVIVAVAGGVTPAAVLRAAEAAFGAMPAGEANQVAAPLYGGGVRTRRQTGSSQSHLVLGFPLPALGLDDSASGLAAVLFGEGMSSPLLHELRERRGLVYYAACSADIGPLTGQFVVEASTTPEHQAELSTELSRLLARQAETIDPVDLQRARNQMAVRRMRSRERPMRRLETAAQDLFHLGRLRSDAEIAAQDDAVDAATLRALFERMLRQPAAAAVAGKLAQGTREHLAEQLATLGPQTAG